MERSFAPIRMGGQDAFKAAWSVRALPGHPSKHVHHTRVKASLGGHPSNWESSVMGMCRRPVLVDRTSTALCDHTAQLIAIKV